MLNIKNPKAHELAVAVAAVTGESLTDAVIHALEDRLVKAREAAANKPFDKAAALALLDDIHSGLPRWFLDEEDSAAFLYDPETGLPA